VYSGGASVYCSHLFGKQGLYKIWRAGFSPVWTQMVATSSTCYDVTFLTKRTCSCSNFVAISSLVLELLKKCRVRWRVGHPIYDGTFAHGSRVFSLFGLQILKIHCLKHRYGLHLKKSAVQDNTFSLEVASSIETCF